MQTVQNIFVMTDLRRRVALLTLLSFIALC
jgi:hypothetical protein